MDLIEDEGAGGVSNDAPWSVSELSGAVKRTLEGAFGHVRVRAEVGRVSRPRSGHVYLDLKDDRAVISGIIWKGVAQRLAHRPEEGLEVIVTGRLTTYPGQGKYQIVIEDLRPAGVGALMAQLEARKKALAAEGLFDQAAKRPLPYLPEVIGVVTSPTGAVIRDILHRLRDRFPRKVLVWPVRVQGQGAAEEVAAAVRGFDMLTPGGALPRPDLVIVARGGGSLEDLWAFNEEAPARAVAACRIPVISAVGHETDTTLIDFVADRRAPTPTAAAEMAVPVRLDLLAHLEGRGERLRRAVRDALGGRRTRLGDLARGLPRPERLLDAPRQRLDLAGARLPAALSGAAGRARARLSKAEGGLRPASLRAMVAERRRRLGAAAGALDGALGRNVQRRRDALGLADAPRTRALAALLRARAQAARRAGGRLAPDALLRRAAADRTALARAVRGLGRAARADAGARRVRAEEAARLLDALGYEATLRRGYAVARDAEGRVVTGAAEAARAARLELRFADGEVRVRPESGRPGAGRAAKGAPETQGTLL